jgi:hypothetical protein
MVKMDAEAIDENSRLALVILNAFTMRQMELWRDAAAAVIGRVPHAEDVMIVGAIQSIGGEKLLRQMGELSARDLGTELPYEQLTTCNLASIAAATGINRETVRRRSNRMVEEGLLIRTDGSFHVAESVLKLPVVREVVHKQLASMQMALHRLRLLGVTTDQR